MYLAWLDSLCGEGAGGQGSISSSPFRVRRTVSAHRIALMLEYGGELPDGMIGEHGCYEPLCVRVEEDHLWPATQAENINHAVELGRHRGNVAVTGSHRRWERSHLVRNAVREGWDDEAYRLARQMIEVDENQLGLW